MTEDLRNERQEAALRQALTGAVDEVTPSTDALTTIRARIDRGEGAMSTPGRVRAGIGDAVGRLRGRSGPGRRPATTSADGRSLTSDDYVVSGSPGARLTAARGRGRKAAMAIAGVFALMTTGLAVNQLTAVDGASSPEDAVHAFFDAIDHEDPLGVLESLTPSEREVLVPSLQRLSEQLKKFEVADDGLDLDHVDGLDLQVKDLQLRTQGLHPDVAAVAVTGGTIETSANFRELPLGKVLAAALDEEGGRDLDEPLDDSIPLDLTLVTVQTDGKWHVSLLYSVAENMRRNKGAPVPDYGNGIPAKGADSPEAAVQAMVAAFNEEDVTRMIELTPPDSAAVLHDYGPVMINDERDDSTLGFEDISFGEPQGSGDRRTLTVENYRLVDGYNGRPITTTVFDGTCVTMTFTPDPDGERKEPEKACADDVESSPGVETSPGFAFGYVHTPLILFLFGPGPITIDVVEYDGAWYVDPARSAIGTLLSDIEASSSEQMDQAVEQWVSRTSPDDYAVYATIGPDWYEDCPDVPEPSADASLEERKAAGQQCADNLSDGYPSDAASTTPATTAPGGITPETQCQEAGDATAVETCFQGLDDPEALANHHVTICYSSEDPSEIEVCLQDLVDEGEIGSVEVEKYRCDTRHRPLIEKDLETFAAAYNKCMEDAGFDYRITVEGNTTSGSDSETTTTVSTPN